MKTSILIILITSLWGCNSMPDQPSGKINSEVTIEEDRIEEETVELNAQVAVDFLNGYIEDCNKIHESMGIKKWVKNSPLVTENFRKELFDMLTRAEEIDPEPGLDFDPIFDAQDYPEKGVELVSFDPETGYLIVNGINWESYEVTMKVAQVNGKVLVDGCGIVNIPEEERVGRD